MEGLWFPTSAWQFEGLQPVPVGGNPGADPREGSSARPLLSGPWNLGGEGAGPQAWLTAWAVSPSVKAN